ncbi:hypothetical protein SAMN06264855_11321 [Halorubrum vacuolatum]|uniref:Uncharacterized protein n=1 Tax=Halorubrum vacuolatum TaxID=63740 RepID=A0A238X435_HALVU|nr:hypothetical protein SAMN06264855_11321 [Halorubrum vacuolatum]
MGSDRMGSEKREHDAAPNRVVWPRLAECRTDSGSMHPAWGIYESIAYVSA